MFYESEKGHPFSYNPFKAIVSPRPIGWISSQDNNGICNLAPYSFFNAVSDNPPMVVFSATGIKEKKSKIKDSIKNITETKEFIVNVVSKDLLDQMNLTSGIYSRDTDEFEIANLTKGKARIVKPPFVADSPASLECRLYKKIVLPGDINILILGLVVGVHINDKYLKNGILDVSEYQPVARLGYTHYTSVSDVFSLLRPGQKET